MVDPHLPGQVPEVGVAHVPSRQVAGRELPIADRAGHVVRGGEGEGRQGRVGARHVGGRAGVHPHGEDGRVHVDPLDVVRGDLVAPDDGEGGVDHGVEVGAAGVDLVAVRLRVPAGAEPAEEAGEGDVGDRREEPPAAVEDPRVPTQARPDGVHGVQTHAHRPGGGEDLGVGAEEPRIEGLRGVGQGEAGGAGEVVRFQAVQLPAGHRGPEEMDVGRHLPPEGAEGDGGVRARRDLVGGDLGADQVRPVVVARVGEGDEHRGVARMPAEHRVVEVEDHRPGGHEEGRVGGRHRIGMRDRPLRPLGRAEGPGDLRAQVRCVPCVGGREGREDLVLGFLDHPGRHLVEGQAPGPVGHTLEGRDGHGPIQRGLGGAVKSVRRPSNSGAEEDRRSFGRR